MMVPLESISLHLQFLLRLTITTRFGTIILNFEAMKIELEFKGLSEKNIAVWLTGLFH